MENENNLSQPTPMDQASSASKEIEPTSAGTESKELTPEQRRAMIIGIVILVLVVIGVIASIIVLARLPEVTVAHIRDIFIIYMALMSLMTGMALVILMVQLARLTNLLQNEIKPILDSLNETISNLRGTAAFLSDNLAEPVIKLNEYMAGLSQLLYTIGILRRKSND
jgi:predicted tellurium resistance membrane protein TerC